MSISNKEHPSWSLPTDALNAGERFLQCCGFVVVLCILTAGAVAPDPPSHGAPDSAVLVFYQQHAAGQLTGTFLWTVGMMALVLFAVVLSRACHRAYAGTALPSHTGQQPGLLSAECVRAFSIVSATLFLVSQAVQSAAGVIAIHGAPAFTVRALDEASHMIGHLSTLPLGCFLLAGGLAQRIARCGARWIAYLGMITGVTLMVTTSWVAIGQQWLHNAGVVALLAFLLWMAASSVSLLRGKLTR